MASGHPTRSQLGAVQWLQIYPLTFFRPQAMSLCFLTFINHLQSVLTVKKNKLQILPFSEGIVLRTDHPCQKLDLAGLLWPLEISFKLFLQQYSLSAVSSSLWSVLLLYLHWASSNDAPKTDEATSVCVFLLPNSKLCCLQQQCQHQDQAFSKVLICAKHRYCQHHRQDRANKSKHTVCPLPVIPGRTQKFRDLFSDELLPISVHLCLSKPRQAVNPQEENEWTQHKALEKLQN